MKTAVVYYSLDGSTKEAAVQIAQRVGAPVFELEEVKKRSGKPMSFMAAAFGALIGKKSKLKENPAKLLADYDVIYLGSPIWASRIVPAINTFLSQLSAAGKQIIFFTLQADPNPLPPEGLNKLTSRLEQKGASATRVIRLHGDKPGVTASPTHIQEQLDKILAE